MVGRSFIAPITLSAVRAFLARNRMAAWRTLRSFPRRPLKARYPPNCPVHGRGPLRPQYVDSGRPLSANSGHCLRRVERITSTQTVIRDRRYGQCGSRAAWRSPNRKAAAGRRFRAQAARAANAERLRRAVSRLGGCLRDGDRQPLRGGDAANRSDTSPAGSLAGASRRGTSVGLCRRDDARHFPARVLGPRTPTRAQPNDE
jgi:hypothetical protein